MRGSTIFGGLTIPANKEDTGKIWKRREYSFLAGWLASAFVLFLIPSVVRCLCSSSTIPPGLLNSAWAAAGGILGALVNVVSLQINHQSLTEPVKRGLTFGPGLGATVAWFVYLGALLDVITINLGAPSEGPPSFPRAVVLGGLAGFGWDVVLGRIRARAKEFTQEE